MENVDICNICDQHNPEIVYDGESCPACREIKKLNLLINAYLEELADYARTVERLNGENHKLKDAINDYCSICCENHGSPHCSEKKCSLFNKP